MRPILKDILVRGASWFTGPLMRDRAVVLMLHRFEEDGVVHEGFPAALLRTLLAHLRSRRARLVALDELAARLAEGRPPEPRTVVFTVDDGYADFFRVGLPIFAEFDCPATVFVVTGFLDGELWLWWDQVEAALGTADRGDLSVPIAGATEILRWNGSAERERAREALVERLKRVPDEERRAVIPRIAAAAGTTIAASAPAAYAPMTWAEVRAAEGRGMRFGPHTVSHPILSRTDDARSEQEIAGSWNRLRAMVSHPVSVFCYPNGDPDSFGPREERTAASSGLTHAVSTTPGYVTTAAARAGAYRLPRFSCPGNETDLLQITSGLPILQGVG